MERITKKISKLSSYFAQNEDMSKHTSFKAGGIARFYCEVSSIKKLVKVIKLIKNVLPYYLLGEGTNTLFLNFNGLVICTKQLNRIRLNKNIVFCECGVSLFKLNSILAKDNLSGLEFSFGIPGSVGGACIMNAGAYGGEFGDFVEKIMVFDKKIRILNKKDFEFEYRNSSLKKQKQIVLAVWLKLNWGKTEQIYSTMKAIMQKRIQTQPQEHSAGSVFKRDGDIIPAKIIDKMGFKGVNYNGAKVSEKHAGFIVNYNNAKPQDILYLIDKIKSEVKKYENIELKEEIEIVGEKR